MIVYDTYFIYNEVVLYKCIARWRGVMAKKIIGIVVAVIVVIVAILLITAWV